MCVSICGHMDTRSKPSRPVLHGEAHAQARRSRSGAYDPGCRYTKTRFTREQTEQTVDKLIADLEAIEPETTQDRWVNDPNGTTFRSP